MTYDPGVHRRRSIRLQGYDYSQAGAHFVTLCTQNRERLFGDIVGATPRGCPEMALNDAGTMIQTVWGEIPFHYAGTVIDEFVAMPNHIHGILIIGAVVGATPRGCPVLSPQKNGHKHGKPDQYGQARENGHENGQARGDQKGGQAQGPAPTGDTGALSLGDIVHRFKTMTTKRYTDGVKQSGW
jgi:putative transposase